MTRLSNLWPAFVDNGPMETSQGGLRERLSHQRKLQRDRIDTIEIVFSRAT
jgi:hypothetical protein